MLIDVENPADNNARQVSSSATRVKIFATPLDQFATLASNR